MSKVKICALGGLNENGKNMYVVEVDDAMLIFDAGLKYDADTTFGVDYVIPDFSYIKENKKRIKGLFLTHGHEEHLGAVPALIKEMPDIPIYGTNYTLMVLKHKLLFFDIKKANLIPINANKSINVDKISVFPLSVTHSVPESVLYVINTKDGAVVYTGNYTFDFAMDGAFKSDLGKLAYIGKQGVLCLLGESLYADKSGHTSPKHRLGAVMHETLRKHPNRIIFNTYASQLFRIKEILQEVSKTNRRIVIMGKILQNAIDDALNNNYLTFDRKQIGDLSNIDDPNVVLLIANDLDNPFGHMYRIVKGYDKYIKIKETDMVIFTEPVIEGTEKKAVLVSNEIAKIGAKVKILSPKDYLLLHASQEDIKLMVNIMNPKYYFPIEGEYRHQVANADAAVAIGFNPDNILLKLNGDVVTFENGELSKDKLKVKADDICIDGKSTIDVGELVLRDREMLGNNGVIIVSTTISRQSKTIVFGPEIATRGFVYVKENIDLIKELSNQAKEVVEAELQGSEIDYNGIKNAIRERLNKYIYTQMECKPMIISIIMEA